MDVKKSEELLAEIYRNCQLALESISDILPAVEHEDLKAEILREHEEYEKISAEAAMLAKNKGLDVKSPNAMKKMMMWSSIIVFILIEPHIIAFFMGFGSFNSKPLSLAIICARAEKCS